eukprot:6634071-Alexandrium_andersonii.AAC.1
MAKLKERRTNGVAVNSTRVKMWLIDTGAATSLWLARDAQEVNSRRGAHCVCYVKWQCEGWFMSSGGSAPLQGAAPSREPLRAFIDTARKREPL